MNMVEVGYMAIRLAKDEFLPPLALYQQEQNKVASSKCKRTIALKQVAEIIATKMNARTC
jgi:hypothetical protein